MPEAVREYIDLSMPIDSQVVTDPPFMVPQINYQTHRQTVPQLASFFPGLKQDDLPDGEAWAVEQLTLSAHAGTHMDAPWHFHSTTADGREPAPSIDEAPLHYFLRPGVKLDFRHFEDGYVATAADIERELARIGYELKPLDIVLVNTRAGAAYGAPDFISKGCGIGHEGTMFLTGKGVKVVGTDAWSWDAPFSYTAARYAETGDPSIIWEGHKAGRFREYYQIEKLFGLDRLPSHGFTLSCFPVKIKRGSAGWIRAVAWVD